MPTAHIDDELLDLAERGMPGLPASGASRSIERAGAAIRYHVFGEGPAVVLLHGGMGSSRNFAYLVPDLIAAGYTAIAVDSRAQGASSWHGEALSYRGMADDVRAILDAEGIDRAAIIGWSDGADTGIVLAQDTPERVAGLFFFACNVDSSGPLPFVYTPVIGRALDHFKADYAELSATPDAFETVFTAVSAMQQGQPELSADELAAIDVPMLCVLGENDEFIRREHIDYLAATVPQGRALILPDVSHFAPFQRPDVFNRAVLDFVAETFR